MTEFLASPRAVNLKKSQHPIGRALPDVAAAIGVGQCFSLGTAGPDTNPAWSIYQGMGEVFKFCQRRAPEKKSPRLNLKGLGLLGSFSRGRSGGSSSRQQQQAPQQPPQQPPQQQGAVVSGASSTDRSAALATGGRSVSSAHSHPGLGTAPAATSSTATSSNMSCASGPYAATESVDQVCTVVL